MVSVGPGASNLTSSKSIDDSVDDLVHSILSITEEPPELIEPEIVEGPQGPNLIKIRVLERTTMTLKCDGYVVFRGKAEAGESPTCNYTDRGIVHLSDITDATVHQNERLIKPMGPQGSARRLTFLDD